MNEARFYEEDGGDARRHAPATARNIAAIIAVLEAWLPAHGTVLEIASGTGQHAVALARRFPHIVWQPSDPDVDALRSIAAWRDASPGANLAPPLAIDAAASSWPLDSADAILSINMLHISRPEASTGLLDGAARLLAPGAALILYGPWIERGVPTAPSNIAFDADLRHRNADWGLRTVEHFAAQAEPRGLMLIERRAMPANNLMLLLRRA